MIKCNECEAFFFLESSLITHNSYCIGYNPKLQKVTLGSLCKINAHTHTHTHAHAHTLEREGEKEIKKEGEREKTRAEERV